MIPNCKQLCICLTLVAILAACNDRTTTVEASPDGLSLAPTADSGEIEEMLPVTLSDGTEVNIYTKAFGNGDETIVFLHGGPGANHSSFAPFFAPLAEQFRLVYYDQIGCGRSDRAEDLEYHVRYDLEVLETVRDHLGLKSWSVVGESWGTFLGLQYASVHPAAVDNLILLSSVGTSLEGLKQFGASLESRVSAEDNATLLKMQELVKDEAGFDAYLQDSRRIYDRYYLHDPANYDRIVQQKINFDQNRKVIAIEMEAYGVYLACRTSATPRPKCFAAKAVCDFGTPPKTDEHQRYAAYTSASFIYEFALDQL